MEAIDELMKAKTIIMIAHRTKTVQNADQILVVDEGKVVQRGKHEQLKKDCLLYTSSFMKTNTPPSISGTTTA